MNLEKVRRLQAERDAIDPDEPEHRIENQSRRAALMRKIDEALDEPRK